MIQFITRVELHHATEKDYEKLHDEMYKQKFFKIILDTTTHEWVRLPTAEYHSYSNLGIDEVAKLAEKTALKTGKSCSILVVQSAGIRWMNLNPAGDEVIRPVLQARI